MSSLQCQIAKGSMSNKISKNVLHSNTDIHNCSDEFESKLCTFNNSDSKHTKCQACECKYNHAKDNEHKVADDYQLEKLDSFRTERNPRLTPYLSKVPVLKNTLYQSKKQIKRNSLKAVLSKSDMRYIKNCEDKRTTENDKSYQSNSFVMLQSLNKYLSISKSVLKTHKRLNPHLI